ncbi:hypothetical protein BH11CYA1_BH11CYA1_24770 [soil metagenome]
MVFGVSDQSNYKNELCTPLGEQRRPRTRLVPLIRLASCNQLDRSKKSAAGNKVLGTLRAFSSLAKSIIKQQHKETMPEITSDNLENHPPYTTSSFHRARWNVMDMITLISTKTIPTHILTDFDMEEAEILRSKLSTEESKVTVTAIILKAIAIAQLSNPQTRALRLPLGHIIQRKEPVAGFTVERMIGTQPAVFFGIINDAHTKPLAQIAKELQNHGTGEIMSVPQLAKEHVLSMFPWILRRFYIAIALHIPFLRQIVNSATFGLTSLGKFNLNTLLAPNISTCIFGVGTVEPRVKVIENEIKARRMMSVVFSADTKVVDMSQAAKFLATIQKLIESGLSGHLTDEEQAQIHQSSVSC